MSKEFWAIISVGVGLAGLIIGLGTLMVISLGSIDTRFASIDARFASIDARFDSIDARFDSIDARLNSIDNRLHNLNARVARIEGVLGLPADADPDQAGNRAGEGDARHNMGADADSGQAGDRAGAPTRPSGDGTVNGESVATGAAGAPRSVLATARPVATSIWMTRRPGSSLGPYWVLNAIRSSGDSPASRGLTNRAMRRMRSIFPLPR